MKLIKLKFISHTRCLSRISKGSLLIALIQTLADRGISTIADSQENVTDCALVIKASAGK